MTAKLICKCEKGPGCMLGSPVNPIYEVEVQEQGEMNGHYIIHFACAADELKEELGCPCDCHRTVDQDGNHLLSSCSFCPMEHKQ